MRSCTCGGPVQGLHEPDCDVVTGRDREADERAQEARGDDADGASPAVYVPGFGVIIVDPSMPPDEFEVRGATTVRGRLSDVEDALRLSREVERAFSADRWGMS